MAKGKIIILSGPSGAGKTTLYKKLLAKKKFRKKLQKIVTVTTRPKRPGERQGRDYIFVSPKMFAYKIRAGHFLEWEKVFDNYYGTPKIFVHRLLQRGKNVLLCIDVKGAKTIRKKYPEAVSIFVTAPSMRELKKRLIRRGSENEQAVRLRISRVGREMKEAKNYKYVVVNKKVSQALRQLEKILSREIIAKSKS